MGGAWSAWKTSAIRFFRFATAWFNLVKTRTKVYHWCEYVTSPMELYWFRSLGEFHNPLLQSIDAQRWLGVSCWYRL